MKNVLATIHAKHPEWEPRCPYCNIPLFCYAMQFEVSSDLVSINYECLSCDRIFQSKYKKSGELEECEQAE
jgi:hypothetical protein